MNRHPLGRRLGGLVLLVGLCVSGCADSDDYRQAHKRCRLYARAAVECYDPILTDDPWGSEYEFRRRVGYLALNCQSKLDSGESGLAIHAMLGCVDPAVGGPPDCVSFDACTRRAKSATNGALLKAAVEAGDEIRVQAVCTMDTDLQGCIAAKEALVDRIIVGRLHAIRDGKDTQAPSTVCFRAKALARSAGKGTPSERAVALMNRVERACRQAAAGRRIREVLVELDRLRQSKRMRIPHRCKSLLSELSRMDSDVGEVSGESKAPLGVTSEAQWASQAQSLVARACYVDWGGDVLDKLLASARKCNPALRDIVKTAREYRLDKALGARYRSALELCPLKARLGPAAGGAGERRGSGSKAPTVRGP